MNLVILWAVPRVECESETRRHYCKLRVFALISVALVELEKIGRYCTTVIGNLTPLLENSQ